jgi:hypothetical protein
MAVDAAEVWRRCFAQWPDELPRRGVLVTSFDEQIPFESFATSPDLLLIERRAPDTVGARTVLIAYQNIQALKVVDVVKVKAFAPLGFVAAHAAKK